MSNSYTAVVNLCKDPEALSLGGRDVAKLRLADNTFGKNAETRYFDALVAGPDYDAAMQLKSGDQIVIAGQLVKTSYKSKTGKNKGKTMEADSMPFGKILQITKSPSFFSGEGKDEESDGTEQTEEPDLTGADPADGDADDPLAGVV